MSPAQAFSATSCTPASRTALTNPSTSRSGGTGGTLVVRGVDASADVTFRNVAAGQVLEVRARYIRATGTTAADLVALA